VRVNRLHGWSGTLSLGIGANTATFAIHAACSSHGTYNEPDRLVSLPDGQRRARCCTRR
jgi:hypothetical protein